MTGHRVITQIQRTELADRRQRHAAANSRVLVLVSLWSLARGFWLLGETWWAVWSHLGRMGHRRHCLTPRSTTSRYLLYKAVIPATHIYTTLSLGSRAGLSDVAVCICLPCCCSVHVLYMWHTCAQQLYTRDRPHAPRSQHTKAPWVGTWMCACMYVACGGAVIMYGWPRQEPGTLSHLVPRGYAAFQKAVLPGVVKHSRNGIQVSSTKQCMASIGRNSTTTTTFVGRESSGDYAQLGKIVDLSQLTTSSVCLAKGAHTCNKEAS